MSDEPSSVIDVRADGEVTEYVRTFWTPERVRAVGEQLAAIVETLPVAGEGVGGARMIDRILNAGSLADIREMFSDMDSSEDVVGKDLWIRGVELRESDYTNPEDPDALDFYVTVDAVNYRDQTEELPFNSSARTVLAVLAVAWRDGYFPFRATMEEKRFIKTGRRAFNLIPVLER
jgi:hypothetical protein